MNYPPMRVDQSAADFFVIDKLLNVAERSVSKRDAEFLNLCRGRARIPQSPSHGEEEPRSSINCRLERQKNGVTALVYIQELLSKVVYGLISGAT